MSKVIFAIIICSIINIAGATELDQEEVKDNKPNAGDNALLFQISTDLRIGSYAGLMISGRHHLSTTRALELRVGLDGETGDNMTKYEQLDDSSAPRRGTGEGYAWIVRFSGLYQMYLNRHCNLMPFWGIGPSFQYRYSNYEYLESDNKSYSESKNIDAGLTGDIGFEWFILPRVSLIAVYRMRCFYSWDTETYEYRDNSWSNKRTRKSESLNVGYENTNLGIGLYF